MYLKYQPKEIKDEINRDLLYLSLVDGPSRVTKGSIILNYVFLMNRTISELVR